MHRLYRAGQDGAGLVKDGDVRGNWGALLVVPPGQQGVGVLVAPDATGARKPVEPQVTASGEARSKHIVTRIEAQHHSFVGSPKQSGRALNFFCMFRIA